MTHFIHHIPTTTTTTTTSTNLFGIFPTSFADLSGSNSVNNPYNSILFKNQPEIVFGTHHSDWVGGAAGASRSGVVTASSSSSSFSSGVGGQGHHPGGVVEYAADEEGGASRVGPHIVAMDGRQTQHQEAYYLFFVGSLGMALNIVIVVIIFLRNSLRRMTSAFLIHASFLNLVKAAFCIPFGLNLLSDADGSKENQPPDCVIQGSSFIVLLTASAFNMVAMVCTEAYTFGEVNVGGNSQGTACCILFGVMVVYVTSVIIHLGPTLIGGDIVYNPEIGNCAFKLGNTTGYVANVMCIIIVTFALIGVGHFLNKFYKEIQQNRPNRVSMLVRHSISFTDDEETQKESVSAVQELTQDAIHRAKIFVITAVAFVLCWYPLFILVLFDMNFTVSPKVYQAFSFIAWSHPVVEPIILIFFDRNLNILSRFMYCDRDHYSASQVAYLLSQQRLRRERQQQQREKRLQEIAGEASPDSDTAAAAAAVALNSHNISMEIEDAFHNVTTAAAAAAATGKGRGGANTLPPPNLCRHCASPASPFNAIMSSTLPRDSSSRTRSNSGSDDTPVSSSTHELRGFQNFKPLAHGQTTVVADAGEIEMNLTPTKSADRGQYDPVVLRDADGNGVHMGNIQC